MTASSSMQADLEILEAAAASPFGVVVVLVDLTPDGAKTRFNTARVRNKGRNPAIKDLVFLVSPESPIEMWVVRSKGDESSVS